MLRYAFVLTLIWTLLVPGCASKSVVSDIPSGALPKEMISYKRLEGLLGLAYWDCDEKYPTAWVRIHFRGQQLAVFDSVSQIYVTPELLTTIAHEQKHLQQAYARGCEPWRKMFEDSETQQIMEAEAYCAGATLGKGVCNYAP